MLSTVVTHQIILYFFIAEYNHYKKSWRVKSIKLLEFSNLLF